MRPDEFAFFNQQLAAMLRDGISLEGALKQLCAGMGQGALRTEIEGLTADLARGTPLPQALASRKLPALYKSMVQIGARTNDLPGMLILLSDHYHRVNTLWTRLKGLMVYPCIVIAVSLGLTLFVAMVFRHFMSSFFTQFGGPQVLPVAMLWMPPVLLAGAAVAVAAALSVPALRARLRWQLPAFREASLAELASAIALMLKNGTTLAEALALAQTLESATPAEPVLAQWRGLVETGHGKPGQWPAPVKPVPPLFLWLVQTGGEDVGAGFAKAAEIYHARAGYRIELALYGALPICILLLGQMIVWQAVPLMRSLIWLMNMLGSVGD